MAGQSAERYDLYLNHYILRNIKFILTCYPLLFSVQATTILKAQFVDRMPQSSFFTLFKSIRITKSTSSEAIQTISEHFWNRFEILLWRWAGIEIRWEWKRFSYSSPEKQNERQKSNSQITPKVEKDWRIALWTLWHLPVKNRKQVDGKSEYLERKETNVGGNMNRWEIVV